LSRRTGVSTGSVETSPRRRRQEARARRRQEARAARKSGDVKTRVDPTIIGKEWE